MADRDLMKPAELSAMLQISESTLANLRSRREGPPYLKLGGGTVRYSRAAIEAWLKASEVNHDR